MNEKQKIIIKQEFVQLVVDNTAKFEDKKGVYKRLDLSKHLSHILSYLKIDNRQLTQPEQRELLENCLDQNLIEILCIHRGKRVVKATPVGTKWINRKLDRYIEKLFGIK